MVLYSLWCSSNLRSMVRNFVLSKQCLYKRHTLTSAYSEVEHLEAGVPKEETADKDEVTEDEKEEAGVRSPGRSDTPKVSHSKRSTLKSLGLFFTKLLKNL